MYQIQHPCDAGPWLRRLRCRNIIERFQSSLRRAESGAAAFQSYLNA
jgi:hypothetical protein